MSASMHSSSFLFLNVLGFNRQFACWVQLPVIAESIGAKGSRARRYPDGSVQLGRDIGLQGTGPFSIFSCSVEIGWLQ